MVSLRFRSYGRINKPLPPAFAIALPVIKDALVDLQGYAQKLNAGKANEEDTNKVTWGNETDCVWEDVDIAIPLPLPQVLQDKLPAIKTKFALIRQYAVSTGEDAFFAKYHICGHEGNPGGSCGPVQDI